MADISLLARLLNGAIRQVDLSQNTLVVTSIKVGAASPTELTKTILDRLVSSQNGSDLDATYHTHDGRYFTESELSSSTASSGSDLIGDDDTYSNFTPTAATVKGALAGIDSALAAVAGNNEFNDDVFRIRDQADNTKKIAFEAAGIATATTRTITMPDSNVNLGLVATAIQRDGSVAFTANQPMGGFKLTGLAAGTGAGDSVRYEQAILVSGANAFAADQSFGGFKATNVADPTAAQDAATKAYVDGLLDGRDWKQSVLVATTANITLSGEQTIDGVLTSSSRVLVKDQTAPEENGIYVSASGAWSRASDANTAAELTGAAVFVEQGTVNADRQYAQTADNINLGVTAISWVLTSANHFSGHDMISLSGGAISVDLAAVSGLESTNPGNAAGQLRVKLEASNPSLQINGSNELGVKLSGSGALASGASGVAVQVDNVGIEISSNALRLKDAGVTAAKLNSNVADQSTITGGAGVALAVQRAPLVKKSMVAGESFAANTSFIVRFALNGETAGRVYKADKDASSTNKYMGLGIALSTGAVSAGQNIDVVVLGTHTLGSSDSNFGATDIGKEVFLTASGAFSVTAPSATNEAVFVIGTVEDVNKIWVDMKQLRYIN